MKSIIFVALFAISYALATCPPAGWTSEYKNPVPVTDADVLGPEGLYFPNFSYAGVEGGIPTVSGA